MTSEMNAPKRKLGGTIEKGIVNILGGRQLCMLFEIYNKHVNNVSVFMYMYRNVRFIKASALLLVLQGILDN